MNKLIKWLIQPNYFWMTTLQLILPICVYVAIVSGADWYWWALSLLFYFLYLCIGNNIGMHRYFCHRYFEMHRPVEWFVAWCAAMGGMGSPICYASIHWVHHKHSDTELDPHGPQRGWKSVLYCFHKQINHSDVRFTRILADLTIRYKILHAIYWPFVFANAFVMFLLGWKVLLFCWLIPAGFNLWAVAFVLLMQHNNNHPNNSRAYMWFGWGETWHKNHHDNVKLANHADTGKIDWTYQFSRLLSK